MKKLFLLLALSALGLSASAYNDYRGINLDSLERVVSRWTPDAVDRATEQELLDLNRAYRDLMLGYSQSMGPKCEFYAHKALSISEPRGWDYASLDSYRYIGQCLYGREQYDSAMVYYNLALDALARMEAGGTSPANPDGYDQLTIDDTRSMLYGTLGNLYNETGDIPRAMEFYTKAGEIFEQYGWNQSNAVLHYNIGETWLDEGETRKAEAAYRKALSFAETADDSLFIAYAKNGLGRLYMETGRSAKALKYLREADDYLSQHGLNEVIQLKNTFQYMSMALRQQRTQLTVILFGLLALLALGAVAMLLARRLRASRREQAETGAVLEETLQELQQSHPDTPQLSAREKEILDLLSKGYTAPQIAEALGLSNETIRWYRKKLIAKFDVSNTAELISNAKESGLI